MSERPLATPHGSLGVDGKRQIVSRLVTPTRHYLDVLTRESEDEVWKELGSVEIVTEREDDREKISVRVYVSDPDIVVETVVGNG